MELCENGIMWKGDFGKLEYGILWNWNFEKWDFMEMKFGILGKWEMAKSGFWEMGLDFGKKQGTYMCVCHEKLAMGALAYAAWEASNASSGMRGTKFSRQT